MGGLRKRNIRVPLDPVDCAECHTIFAPRNNKGKFCRPKCRSAYYWRHSSPNLIEKTCDAPGCEVAFEAIKSGRRYCSTVCAFGGNTNRQDTGATPRVCAECGCSTLNPKFCSSICFQLGRRSDKLREWLAGGDGGVSSGGLRSAARRFLLEEAGFCCTRCGWGEPNPVLGRPILTIDHIDGDYTNNRRSNLVVLCFNCHTLTETFGSLNVGRGPGRKVYSRHGRRAEMRARGVKAA